MCLLVLLNQAAEQVWLEALTVVVTRRAPYVEPDLYYPLLLLLPLLLPVAYGLVSPGWPLASSQAARSSLHMENSPKGNSSSPYSTVHFSLGLSIYNSISISTSCNCYQLHVIPRRELIDTMSGWGPRGVTLPNISEIFPVPVGRMANNPTSPQIPAA